MALIKCSECGREISDRAEACPGCGAPVTANPEQRLAGAPTAVHYNPDTRTFSGSMTLMVKLAMRAVQELGWKLDQTNEDVGLVTFETGMSWGSWSGVSCSLNIDEVSPNTFRITGTGKQNVRGGQMLAPNLFGEAQSKADKAIEKMKVLAGRFMPKMEALYPSLTMRENAAPALPVREAEPEPKKHAPVPSGCEPEPEPRPEPEPEPRRHAPVLHRPSGGW
jgi:zinc-ribbon domain